MGVGQPRLIITAGTKRAGLFQDQGDQIASDKESEQIRLGGI